jgi:hypothetical protein
MSGANPPLHIVNMNNSTFTFTALRSVETSLKIIHGNILQKR